MGTRSLESLKNLESHVEDMLATVRAALRGELEALDTVLSEYGGAYTKLGSLVNAVGYACQCDDDEAAELAEVQQDFGG